MKVLVLASPVLTPVMRAKLAAAGSGLTFVDSPEEFLKDRNADAFFDLEFKFDKNRINLLSELLPKPVFVNSVAYTLKEIGQPFIRICGWPTLLEKDICEIVVEDPSAKISAQEFLGKMQWKYQHLPDVVGMVSARVIAMIINEAYFTAQEQISSFDDIDTAMKLGTNYPFGPFEWAKKIGLENVHELLLALNAVNPDYPIAKMLAEEVAYSRRS